MADRMTIKGIKGFGHHGVHSMERRAGQEFLVDLVLEVDMREAAVSDDLMDALDYSVLARRVHELVEGSPLNLIESVAHHIARSCLDDERVVAIDVTVHKPQAPVGVPVSDVSVSIRRTRSDFEGVPAP